MALAFVCICACLSLSVCVCVYASVHGTLDCLFCYRCASPQALLSTEEQCGVMWGRIAYISICALYYMAAAAEAAAKKPGGTI